MQEAAGKKLSLAHEIWRGETLAATATQLLIHVSLETRRACEPLPRVAAAMKALLS